MKSLWRIITFTKNLWPYYALVATLSVIVAILAQSVPLITGVVIGQLEIVKTPEFNANLIWILVALMFAQAILSSFVSNI